MEIQVQEYKFDHYVSLSQKYQYYLKDTPKHIRHGLFESWHPNGQKHNETHWVHGRLHGKATIWRSDGSLTSMGNFKEGREDGLWQYWHANSRLSARELMEDGIVKEGEYYAPNGEQVSSVKNGTGRCVFFNDEGKIVIDKTLDQGKLKNLVLWYANGQLREREAYLENGLLEAGEYFSPEGVKLSEVIAGNGIATQPMEIESSSGVIKICYLQEQCREGVLQDGTWID